MPWHVQHYQSHEELEHLRPELKDPWFLHRGWFLRMVHVNRHKPLLPLPDSFQELPSLLVNKL